MTTKSKIKTKVRVYSPALKANIYDIMCMAIENGISYGWNRAHKHSDRPQEEVFKDELFKGVMNCLLDWFSIPE